jgi:hypothetical protein
MNYQIMIETIKIYVLVISVLFIIRIISNIVFLLFNTKDPKPLTLEGYEKILIYLTLSYIITYILTL